MEAPDVAALGDVAGVTEPVHQLAPCRRDSGRAPADLGRLAGEAVAGNGRQHEVERVSGASAVGGRIRERADGLEQLDDRAGPPVGHDQRQRVLVLRLDVDEVDVDAVDLGLELRQRVELRLGLAPVVVGLPVARELLQGRQLDALRPICDQLLGGPARLPDAPAQVVDLRFWNLDVERTDVGAALDGGAHRDLLTAGWASPPPLWPWNQPFRHYSWPSGLHNRRRRDICRSRTSCCSFRTRVRGRPGSRPPSPTCQRETAQPSLPASNASLLHVG